MRNVVNLCFTANCFDLPQLLGSIHLVSCYSHNTPMVQGEN